MKLSIAISANGENHLYGINETTYLMLEVTAAQEKDNNFSWYLDIPEYFFVGDILIKSAILENYSPGSFLLSIEAKYYTREEFFATELEVDKVTVVMDYPNPY